MNEKLKNIVLTGFRATGKSSVGKMLAQKIGYSFIDADLLLCERLGAPIADIVARHGWPFFREAERRLLREVPRMVQTVVATGGGAIEHQEEWLRLRSCCYIVWLDADVVTIRQRMSDDPHSTGQRPSLTGQSASDEIEELLQRRAPLYLAGSDLRLDTVGKGPAALVERIVQQMRIIELKKDGECCAARSNEGESGQERGKGEVRDEKRSREVQSVWMVTREYDRLAGAGGVKDVCRQLAETLATDDQCSVRVIMPRYGFMDAARLGFVLACIGQTSGRINGRRYDHTFEVDMNYAAEERREMVAIWQATLNGVTVFLVEADRFATKRGVYTYTEEDEQEVAWQHRGGGHFDYFAMNILLQKAALDLMMLLDDHPDVIHCQDGHAATLPAMMRENAGYRHYFRQTGAVVTVHNAGVGYHQDVEDLEFAHAITGLPERVIVSGQLGGSFDPFMAASDYAVLNTVSENYGRELQQTPEDARTGWLGHFLLKKGVILAGITNGIDPAAFDPTRAEQLGLAAAYDVLGGELSGKRSCKAAMLAQIAGNGPWEQVKQFGTLASSLEMPLFTFIGRLTAQKGVDILIQAIQAILALLPQEQPAQFLVFGTGGPEFEKQLELLTTSAIGQGKVCFLKGYDSWLANKVYAAGDFLLIPSQYEPCGLTDFIAQLLGNLPIVHRVGGLVKVIDGQTGFSFTGTTATALAAAMSRALTLYRQDPDRLRTMQMAAAERIVHCHTWEKVKDAYLLLYQQAMQKSCSPNCVP